MTIAHRLDTIYYYDKVAVLHEGSIKEVGPPQVLAEQEDSIFADMWRQYNVKGGH